MKTVKCYHLPFLQNPWTPSRWKQDGKQNTKGHTSPKFKRSFQSSRYDYIQDACMPPKDFESFHKRMILRKRRKESNYTIIKNRKGKKIPLLWFHSKQRDYQNFLKTKYIMKTICHFCFPLALWFLLEDSLSSLVISLLI